MTHTVFAVHAPPLGVPAGSPEQHNELRRYGRYDNSHNLHRPLLLGTPSRLIDGWLASAGRRVSFLANLRSLDQLPLKTTTRCFEARGAVMLSCNTIRGPTSIGLRLVIVYGGFLGPRPNWGEMALGGVCAS